MPNDKTATHKPLPCFMLYGADIDRWCSECCAAQRKAASEPAGV